MAKNQQKNGSWLNDKEPAVIFALYQMEREGLAKAEINREGFPMEVEMKQDGFYYLKEFLITKEDVRLAWSNMATIDKLRAEAPGISYEPKFDWVIIKPIEADAFKRTKLHIPESAQANQKSLYQLWKEMPLQGIVVAVGPGFFIGQGERRPTECEVGDHIVIEHGSAVVSDFVYYGKHYYTVRASNILGSMPEEFTNSHDLKFMDPSKI